MILSYILLLSHMASVTFFMSRNIYNPCFLFYFFCHMFVSAVTVKAVCTYNFDICRIEITFLAYIVSFPYFLNIPVTFLSDICPVMSECWNHSIFVMGHNVYILSSVHPVSSKLGECFLRQPYYVPKHLSI